MVRVQVEVDRHKKELACVREDLSKKCGKVTSLAAKKCVGVRACGLLHVMEHASHDMWVGRGSCAVGGALRGVLSSAMLSSASAGSLRQPFLGNQNDLRESRLHQK